jgi:hypothetical protein
LICEDIVEFRMDKCLECLSYSKVDYLGISQKPSRACTRELTWSIGYQHNVQSVQWVALVLLFFICALTRDCARSAKLYINPEALQTLFVRGEGSDKPLFVARIDMVETRTGSSQAQCRS